jgi:adenine-specific DNA-methyltransferase
MIYIDPPYGVKFGSNFQPFVRKRDVSHNDDEDLTREPEMVKAYRDTWELGLHSYLTYMRDRLLLARDLLAPSGSVFVQISDENLHHVRELMDEVFGAENALGLISFTKTSGLASVDRLQTACDYLLWYGRDREKTKYRPMFADREEAADTPYSAVELKGGERRPMNSDERSGRQPLPEGARVYRIDNLTKPGPGSRFAFEFDGRRYEPGKRWWGTTPEGMERLKESGRLSAVGNGLYFVRFATDFPFRPLTSLWSDTSTGGFVEEKLYVVQTNSKVIARCVLMTTDPGDLVIDPTCGSGTTAFVAEQWGRRWITIDTSRVPLALARQRLLTATYPYYQLKESERGPASGFVYVRKQNKKGEEVGGIVPHVTLKSIANNEPPDEEVLVDRPETDNKIVRVTGPFAFEATIPTPVDWEGDGIEDSGAESEQAYGSFIERMIEVLRRSPILHLGGGKRVELLNVRPPARSLSLSAEALVAPTAEGQTPTVADAVEEAAEKSGRALPFSGKPVAFVFGPENGAVSEKLVHEALKEASLKHYTHLYVVGFAIQPHARQLVDNASEMGLISATYVQATPDLMMGDLLKNMRSSQIFSVCGLPDIALHKAPAEKKGGPARHEVELLGLDTFDPTTMEPDHRNGNDVPAWFLDTDYNGLCFHVSQAFFPRTGAWNDLKKALKGDYDDSVWDHLAGTRSAPFEAGEHKQIAVKVIDDRGNELLVVKALA